MSTIKKLGIWMDHSTAHLMDFTSLSIESRNIESVFTNQEKETSLIHGESQMHNKEHQLQSSYYTKLGEVIKNYEDVILFGPTDAKTELLNILKTDHLFAKIKIRTKQTDKMTENQQYAFVKAYFLK
jgi:hypothetical protein